MARLNARQKRAAKARCERIAQAKLSNPTCQPEQGVIKSMQAAFDGGKHRAPHGTYKVSAVRPTLVTGKRKSGKTEHVHMSDLVSIGVVTHDRGNPAKVASPRILKLVSGKVKPVLPKVIVEHTAKERYERAKARAAQRVRMGLPEKVTHRKV